MSARVTTTTTEAATSNNRTFSAGGGNGDNGGISAPQAPETEGEEKEENNAAVESFFPLARVFGIEMGGGPRVSLLSAMFQQMLLEEPVVLPRMPRMLFATTNAIEEDQDNYNIDLARRDTTNSSLDARDFMQERKIIPPAFLNLQAPQEPWRGSYPTIA